VRFTYPQNLRADVQGLKFSLPAVFTRTSAELTCGICAVRSLNIRGNPGYAANTGALVFFLEAFGHWVLCCLAVPTKAISTSYSHSRSRALTKAMWEYGSSLRHRRRCLGDGRGFSAESSSILCLCCSVSLRAPFIQLQRALQLMN